MTGVTVKFIDKDNLQVAIRRASAPPNSRILSAVASRMRGMQMQHFKEQKDSEGKVWAPLKPGTIKRRRMGGRGGVKILQDTGRMRASVDRYSDRDTAITGTNTIYAATHQFGREGRTYSYYFGEWGGADIPAREFIYLTEGEQKTLIEFVSKEIVGPLMKRKN